MNSEELKTFIDVVVNYFQEVTGENVEMGVPYLKESEAVIQDYTGIIGISGARKGGIYITASTGMLTDLCHKLLGETSEEILADMAGEIANTIAGNVRGVFGPNFLISVPVILKGPTRDILLRTLAPVFIIPVLWRSHRVSLVIGLE